MGKRKTPYTSHKVSSHAVHSDRNRAGYLAKRVVKGIRQMEKEREELRMHRQMLMKHSSTIERDMMREHGMDDRPPAVTRDAGPDEWMAGEPVEDEDGWHTEEEETEEAVFSSLVEGIDEIYNNNIPRNYDPRTRRDRTQRQNEAWARLYPALVDAHLQWANHGQPAVEGTELHPPIRVLNLFDSGYISFPDLDQESFTVTLARHGYFGNAPLHPSLAISTGVLELFRALTVRCPQLSAQAFVKTLCELHSTAYHPGVRNNFTKALDAYLEVHRILQHSLNVELGRDSPKWRLRNACAACTYELEDEPRLQFSMLIAMDGNESLKRVERTHRETDHTGRTVFSSNTERQDSRTITSDMFLNQDQVDRFKDDVKRSKSRLSGPSHPAAESTVPAFRADSEEGQPTDGMEQTTPCVRRWANLADEASKKRMGIFDETGLFMATCRHGNALIMCDMVKSGELAKYALAVSNELLDTFGSDIMQGYDIGCGFSATANNSPLVGPKLRKHNGRYCVGAFHGHAHSRVCQLDWHPLYIKGCGLEDFETCERVFSRSNALASVTRHSTKFHRHQLMQRWFETWNVEKYAECSKFLYDNYRQALRNIATLTAPLERSMDVLKIPSKHCFELWHDEERQYLNDLKQESEDDVLPIEYLETLIKLSAAEAHWTRISDQWDSADRSDPHDAKVYRHSLETVLTLQKAVQDLERRLKISERWGPTSPEWIAAQERLNTRKYRRAVDTLEGLIVARLFELSKAHQSGTGYKLRKHISKALRARSQGIRAAVKNYNEAAAALDPPRPHLDVHQILDYVYLAQFDLLRESRYGVHLIPWAQPAEREAAIAYFKIERSHEELQRVNLEVRRLHTWIVDEEESLQFHARRLEAAHSPLALFVRQKYDRLVAINTIHRRYIQKIESLSGFSGRRGPGVRKGGAASSVPPEPFIEHNPNQGDIEDDEAGDEHSDEDVTADLDSTLQALLLPY